MRASTYININLATKPMRNRRLFLLIRNFLAVLLLLSLGFFFFTGVKYGWPLIKLRSAFSDIQGEYVSVQNELKRIEIEVKRKEKELGKRVENVNRIINLKSVSWTKLLSDLEEALHPRSYITSFTPKLTGENSIAIRIKVKTNNLEELMHLIEGLNKLNYKKIRAESEMRESDGKTITEISFYYDILER